ncbi:hypothetical protein Q4511_13765 [Paracoccus sp. 1_MG-2023]|uniref:hypothetical protein n=1 Tax=Paracoccus sp. 1_MG-2023 TaxID=3062651 RepID=UPI0026E284D7|nr:hypothetical protein [Paracoccus sp. 1_MG-2023]MDO6669995.1 hypothetical protein [Paracoccus sp. 1_MG-2023]
MDGLKNAMPQATFENWSVGASPGIQFSAYLYKDFSFFDYVFFDSVPNDEVFARKTLKSGERFFSEDYFNGIIGDIMSLIATQTNLVVVAIPRRDEYGPYSNTLLERKKASGQVGAHFVNFGDKIEEICRIKNLDIESCYEDHPAHPLRMISFDIGHELGQAITKGEIEKTSCNIINKNEYLVYESKDWELFPKDCRKNSVMEEVFSLVKDGQHIEFPEGRCIGYFVNVKNTYCSVSLEDVRGNSVFKTGLYYSKSVDGLQKMFIAIPNGLRGSRLVCGHDVNTDSIGTKSGRYNSMEDDIILSISSVCVMKE